MFYTEQDELNLQRYTTAYQALQENAKKLNVSTYQSRAINAVVMLSKNLVKTGELLNLGAVYGSGNDVKNWDYLYLRHDGFRFRGGYYRCSEQKEIDKPSLTRGFDSNYASTDELVATLSRSGLVQALQKLDKTKIKDQAKLQRLIDFLKDLRPMMGVYSAQEDEQVIERKTRLTGLSLSVVEDNRIIKYTTPIQIRFEAGHSVEFSRPETGKTMFARWGNVDYGECLDFNDSMFIIADANFEKIITFMEKEVVDSGAWITKEMARFQKFEIDHGQIFAVLSLKEEE